MDYVQRTAFRPGGEIVTLGDRMVPSVWEIERTDDAGQLPAIRARVEVREGVPELRELSVKSTETGEPIDTMALRSMSLEHMIDDMAAMAGASLARWGVGRSDPGGVTVDDIITAAKDARRQTGAARRKRKITPARLREAADVYRGADGSGVMAVAEHFDVQRRMATIYVQRARDAGYLSQED